MWKIAVITRTKNRTQLLRRCAENLSKQSMKDFQWVVVNDAGDRGEVERVCKYAREIGLNVLLLHREQSIGIAAAANHGIINSQSEYVHIHDDDDSIELNFYELLSRFLDEKKNYGGVVSSTSKIVEIVSSDQITFVSKERLLDSEMATHLADILVKNQFTTISFVYRRSVCEAIGLYDNSLPVLEDWDFNIRFLIKYDIGAIGDYLANYHHRIVCGKELNPQTVACGSTLHEDYSAILRNRYIRNASTEKEIGIALIMANGRYHQLTSSRIKVMDDCVRSSSWIGNRIKNVLSKLRV